MELSSSATATLVPTAPFHFDGTVFNPSHFPGEGSRWEPGRLWMAMRWQGRTYGVRLINAGSIRRPKIRFTVFARQKPSGGVMDALETEIRWRFDFESLGVPEFVRRFRHDRFVGPAIRRRPGMRPADTLSPYEYLVVTVLLQNTVVRRSVRMLQALYERYGQRVTFDGRELWAFWDPTVMHRASERELRALKVGYRATMLKKQAAEFARGEIDAIELRRIRDRSVVAAALDRIYGVGPQSAGYMLAEYFHFYDALDHVPPWESKIMGRVLFGHSTAAGRIVRFFRERYGEFCQLAFHYLFTDLFWQHRRRPIDWLQSEIRL